mmetsp:Transcript_30083/g.48492  ORF Transcript_30083/g.48492 Transcript_30083/m.48492 type:complete len:528 (-) Transcript_30083:576-2159(-)
MDACLLQCAATRLKPQHAILGCVTAYTVYHSYKFLVQVVTQCYKARILNKIPGPKSDSIFWGHFWMIRLEEPYTWLGDWLETYGNVCCFREALFGYRVMISSVEDLKRVLVAQPKRYPKPQLETTIIRIIAGNGLLAVEGESHTRLRRIVSKAFSFDAVHKLYPTFVEQADILLSAWTQVCAANTDQGNRTILDIGSQMNYVSLDIIGLTAFGYAFESLKGAECEVRKAYNKIMPMAGNMSVIPIFLKMFPILNFLPVPSFLQVHRAQKTLQTLVRRIVDVKAARFTNISDQDLSRSDLLDLMIQSGANNNESARLSNEELADNVQTFLFAGHDTISSALSWAHYLLALNPEKRSKLRQELTDKLDGRAPTYQELADNAIPYLRAVIMEVMRLYPPLPVTVRVTTDDDSFGGYDVPRDTVLVLSPSALGRHPDLWEKPNDFIPERWFASDGSLLQGNEKHPFAWMPFLAGERSCIGRGFAEKEYMCLLAMIVQRVDLDIAPECPKIRSKTLITQVPFPILLMTAKIL